ncbi:MAG: undecaprenyl-diphosphatase [Actinomycetota bacterium]|nr:undecaprenyl-diphosphatase [Actinomycetota bacterium]
MLSAASPETIPVLHAIVLGIVQGLSEFLPISSSGHLILVPWLFGWEELAGAAHADFNRTFDVALHLGTFVGAAAYFRADLVRLARAAWASVRARRVENPDQRLAWLLALSALPGASIGAVLESTVGDHLGQIWLIAVLLIVFGVVLLVADRLPGRRGEEEFRLRDAAVMGLLQAAALAPGVSRSGITISTGRALGFDRNAAARISFLMSLPIIAGAGIYQGAKVVTGGGLPPGSGPAFAWGMLASAVTGAAAVWLVLRVVRTQSFAPFVIYRVFVGLAVLGLLASSFR